MQFNINVPLALGGTQLEMLGTKIRVSLKNALKFESVRFYVECNRLLSR